MAKKLTMVFGVVFILIGALGFIPNPIVGDSALFHTNLVHNIVHIVSGLIFIFAAKKSEESSRMILKVFGVVYLLVAILGFLAVGAENHADLFGLISVNAADNWLHIVLALVFLVVGLKKQKLLETPGIPQGI